MWKCDQEDGLLYVEADLSTEIGTSCGASETGSIGSNSYGHSVCFSSFD